MDDNTYERDNDKNYNRRELVEDVMDIFLQINNEYYEAIEIIDRIERSNETDPIFLNVRNTLDKKISGDNFPHKELFKQVWDELGYLVGAFP